ncbi:Protein ANTAGONIST OF LIKE HETEROCHROMATIN PROTEIN 1 [Frankliniella fusca]|uniref:Protein ANTAGONIST OF LIKE HETEROCHROMATIN PROTEIN 1 n=1 Tax=Frankliniella fusca TaxID=407009 RepID=A0AAE1H515_9NEOP|nr:Protein ANTAGONIST OF LIKE HETEROCHROMATIN PROTEIN 1 [Frankliniella fusca]
MENHREFIGALAVVAAELIEKEEEDEEVNLMEQERVAVLLIMEMEEGEEVINDLDGPAWEPVTVNIDDYHRMSDRAFKRHFRMSRIVFERICQIVYNHLHAKGRIRRVRRDFEDIMLMVIWFLATPDSFRSVALRFGVVESTIYYFYTYVIEALRELAAELIVWPMPLDFLTVVDDTLCVRHVHVGEVRSMNDRRVFRRSNLYESFLRDEEHQFLSNFEHLVGDGGYTLTEFVMIPFANPGNLTPQQRNFNRRPVFELRNLMPEPKANGAEELRRPIHQNEILEGQENEDNDNADELIGAAEALGIEKRIMIMNILPPL